MMAARAVYYFPSNPIRILNIAEARERYEGKVQTCYRGQALKIGIVHIAPTSM